jgi:hypothetical protein
MDKWDRLSQIIPTVFGAMLGANILTMSIMNFFECPTGGISMIYFALMLLMVLLMWRCRLRYPTLTRREHLSCLSLAMILFLPSWNSRRRVDVILRSKDSLGGVSGLPRPGDRPPVCHAVPQDPEFFLFLLRIAEESAAQTREARCQHCGGTPHSARYPCKPRGGPSAVLEEYCWRFSFTCGQCE